MKLFCNFLRVLEHADVILSLCFITFSILDWYNPMMAFTTNPLSAKLLIVFCIVTLLSSLGNLFLERRINAAAARQSRDDPERRK
jgi:hypothetical protein